MRRNALPEEPAGSSILSPSAHEVKLAPDAAITWQPFRSRS
jgi:hypothetical protein